MKVQTALNLRRRFHDAGQAIFEQGHNVIARAIKEREVKQAKTIASINALQERSDELSSEVTGLRSYL